MENINESTGETTSVTSNNPIIKNGTSINTDPEKSDNPVSKNGTPPKNGKTNCKTTKWLMLVPPFIGLVLTISLLIFIENIKDSFCKDVFICEGLIVFIMFFALIVAFCVCLSEIIKKIISLTDVEVTKKELLALVEEKFFIDGNVDNKDGNYLYFKSKINNGEFAVINEFPDRIKKPEEEKPEKESELRTYRLLDKYKEFIKGIDDSKVRDYLFSVLVKKAHNEKYMYQEKFKKNIEKISDNDIKNNLLSMLGECAHKNEFDINIDLVNSILQKDFNNVNGTLENELYIYSQIHKFKEIINSIDDNDLKAHLTLKLKKLVSEEKVDEEKCFMYKMLSQNEKKENNNEDNKGATK